MTKLKAGDKVVCRLKGGRIVSPYSSYEEELDFEVIALDFKGYFLYVPEYYSISGTTIISQNQLKSLKIDKRFLDCQMIYTGEGNIHRVRAVLDGMQCNSCLEFFPWAEPNQEDGSMICWSCRNYKFYK